MRQQNLNEFKFSKKETAGLIILLIIIGMLFSFPAINNRLGILRNKDIDALVSVEEIPKPGTRIYQSRQQIDAFMHNKSAKVDQYFQFDPNKIGLSDWQKLGLSSKQAQAILNYISKGGYFKSPQDLQKMYVITPELYAKLLPFVLIEEPLKIERSKPNEYKATNKGATLDIIDINLADSLALLKIRGIGPAYARRILMYRERLGGFRMVNQLLEVYGFDSIRLENMKSSIKIGNLIRYIAINTVTFEELRKHPYLKYHQASSIIAYRQQHGNFTGMQDLQKVKTLNPETLEKLGPYLKFTQ